MSTSQKSIFPNRFIWNLFIEKIKRYLASGFGNVKVWMKLILHPARIETTNASSDIASTFSYVSACFVALVLLVFHSPSSSPICTHSRTLTRTFEGGVGVRSDLPKMKRKFKKSWFRLREFRLSSWSSLAHIALPE